MQLTADVDVFNSGGLNMRRNRLHAETLNPLVNPHTLFTVLEQIVLLPSSLLFVSKIHANFPNIATDD